MSTCCLHVLSISIMIMKDYLRFVTLILICIVFYIKKYIYSSAGCIFCFHLSINTFFSVKFTLDFCCLRLSWMSRRTWKQCGKEKLKNAQVQIPELIQWGKKGHLYFFTSIFYTIRVLQLLFAYYQGQKKNPKKCHCAHTPGSIPDVCHGQQFRETKVAFCTVSTGESGESAILFVQVKYSAPGDEWGGCLQHRAPLFRWKRDR